MIIAAGDHHVVRPDPTASTPTCIDVPAARAFVVIMRDDTSYCVREFGRRLTGVSEVAEGVPAPALAESYHLFQRDVRSALRDGMRRSGDLEFHLVDAHRLELAVRSRLGGGTLISLDPLVERDVIPLRVSRGFLLGGRTSVGLVPRPGAAPIAAQIAAIPADAPGEGCTLIEDDVFTGGTISDVIRLLRAAGRRVRHVVPGILLDQAAQSGILGATVDPVLLYRTVGSGQDARATELADPRNFLLGLSGLVVRLPDGTWGRAPYWLPFVRTSARVGIPVDAENEFAFRMIEANIRFFARAERLLLRTVRVADLSLAAQRLLMSLEAAQPLEPVRSVLERLMTAMDQWTQLIEELEERGPRAPMRSAGV
ncbi:hypothetical protein [Streptomyces sp. NPDC048282]|uniref:hypothetical protein n=1 Tax=Streptomyces sp. NPDC048282 TaxID=3365528 RepID=UPI003711932E